MLVLLAVVSLLVVSGCAKAYWRPNTSYNEAKEDVMRCHEKAWDAFKAGEISWEKEGKSYRHKCMEEKGYILRNKEEGYPERNPGAKSTSNQPRRGTDTGWEGDRQEEYYMAFNSGWGDTTQYHRIGCPYGPKTSQMGVKLSKEQVKAKGLKPCPICKP